MRIIRRIRYGIFRNRARLSSTLIFTAALALWDLAVSELLPVHEIATDLLGFFLCGLLASRLHRKAMPRMLYPAGAIGWPGSSRPPERDLLAGLSRWAKETESYHRFALTIVFLAGSWELLLAVHIPMRECVVDMAEILALAAFVYVRFESRLVHEQLRPFSDLEPGSAETFLAEARTRGIFSIGRSGADGNSPPSPGIGTAAESPGSGPGKQPSFRHSVLLVDDDPEFLSAAGVMLRAEAVAEAHLLRDAAGVFSILEEKAPTLVVLGLGEDGHSAMELLRRIREENPGISVIVLSGAQDVALAVECMKAGAADYLLKPVEKTRFLSSVLRALEMRELRDQVEQVREQALSPPGEEEISFRGIRTRNRKMISVIRYLRGIAASRQPVLIGGETGAGKELIARAIHEESGVKGAFVAVNVAGLDDTMFSDALFGHRKGAFTGAATSRDGLIARAAGGTLFLDEIGDLAEPSQVKLVRLLEEREYYPLGADVPRVSQARILCATHRNLKALASEGKFRKDLYYRLSGHPVNIPPLRERTEDIPLLADRFLEEGAAALRKRRPTAPPELITLLASYEFPGNVREMKMMFLDALSQHRGGVLSLEVFRRAIEENRHRRLSGEPYGPVPKEQAPFLLGDRFPSLEEAERYLVSEALRRARNNQGIAATLLGLKRAALNKRLCRGRGASS